MRRRIALLVALWAAAVVGVAAVTWEVVEEAGGSVMPTSAGPAATAGASGTAPPSVGPDRTWTSARPRHRPVRHQTRPTSEASPTSQAPAQPTPAEESADAPTTAPSPTASPTPGPRGSAGPGTHHVHASPTAAADPVGPAATGSWSGAAGVVTVTCGPAGIELDGATPADGYRVRAEVEDDRVVVELTREHPEDEVHVSARCVDGAPAFWLDADGAEHED